MFLDGVYSEVEDSVTFHPLGRLSTKDVEGVLEDAVARMTRYLRRRGLLDEENAGNDNDTNTDSPSVAALSASRYVAHALAIFPLFSKHSARLSRPSNAALSRPANAPVLARSISVPYASSKLP